LSVEQVTRRPSWCGWACGAETHGDGGSSKNSSTRFGRVSRELVDDAVHRQAGRRLFHDVAEELHEICRAGRVGDPGRHAALVHGEPGEQHGGAVAAVLELLAFEGYSDSSVTESGHPCVLPPGDH